MFIAVGSTGGIVAFIAFILVTSAAPQTGNAMKKATDVKDQWLFWLLGGTLFVDVVELAW